MRKEPHKHHEGPITVELCELLMADFARMGKDVPINNPGIPDGDAEWFLCRMDWLQNFEYASLRVQEVIDDIEAGVPLRPTLHGRIIDICLSIKDDFEYAQVHNLVKPE